MIIALPLTDDQVFATHFGAATRAALYDVDRERRRVALRGVFAQAELSPCHWAPWLRGLGVDGVLAGGMGAGARERLVAAGIEVVVGLPPGDAGTLLRAWLDGRLETGANACAGGHHGEAGGARHDHGAGERAGCCHGHGHDHGHGHELPPAHPHGRNAGGGAS